MFTRVDRLQMAVPDRAEAAKGWVELLGAEHAGDDRVGPLGVLRSRYRLGDGWVELLEPDGTGAVGDAVASRGGHLFAGGMATPDVDAFAAHLRRRGVEPIAEHGQLFLGTNDTGGHGLRLVISPDEPQPATGTIDHFYEITNLVHDAEAAVKEYVALFGLEDKAFQPIASDDYGYRGTLTLLADDRLDRFEVITPTDPDKTMGRYFARFGESLYMCFAETGELNQIEERCRTLGRPFTRVPPEQGGTEGRPADTVFLHPGALGGMMLGLSRRTVAWVWSGHPDRVQDWRNQRPSGAGSGEGA